LAIKATADTISSILRAVDVSGRIGGEEFAIILPQTQVVHAETIANRLRNLVSQITVPANGTEVAFTVSIGVTKNHDREASINDVLERADTALYEAKTQGRNKVIVG
jgi:diguanylate cyclase (GGDEF)-like protein